MLSSMSACWWMSLLSAARASKFRSFKRFTHLAIPRVLVTGAAGFIGSAMVRALSTSSSYVCRASSRRKIETVQDWHQAEELGAEADWTHVLHDVDIVIHCAAIAHVFSGVSPERFREVNVRGALRLAEQAASAGVRRFVFLSSIGVNGDSSDRPFSECDVPRPENDYARSKLEAEQALRHFTSSVGMELVIVRPVLVYGIGAPGNIARLSRLLRYSLPLPFSGIRNKRSLLAIDNLVDLLLVCCSHPAAVDQVFLASDGEDISTPDLLRLIGKSIGVKVWLFPVPQFLLTCVARLFGREREMSKLTGALQVNIAKARERLSWTPPLTMKCAVESMLSDSVSIRAVSPDSFD